MQRGYCGIGLHMPKTNVNIGSVIRAMGCWDVNFLALTGKRYKMASTDTMKAYRHKPVFQVEDLHEIIPYDCIPVVVEVDGSVCLSEYKHPQRAFYIFGPEDGSICRKITSWCRDIIRIPAGCLNLAAAVNVVLYDRTLKGMQLVLEGGE